MTGMANPLGIGRDLADGSVIGFTPDARYSNVEFDCYRGDQLASTVSMPFLGWAVVAFRRADDPACYYTRLLATGLGEDGTPATLVDVRRLHDLEAGVEIKTRLVADGGFRSLSRIPIDEIISNFDSDPDPLFEGPPDSLYGFPLAGDDSADDTEADEPPGE